MTTTPALPTRCVADEVAALPALLRSEVVKFTSLRSSTWVPVATAVTSFGVAWAVGTFAEGEALVVDQVFAYPMPLTALIASVMGILVFSAEAQHGMLGALVSAHPGRWVIAVAKAAAAGTYGIALAAAGCLAGVAGARVAGLSMLDASTLATTGLAAMAFSGLAALLGLGIGMVTHSSTAAITVLLAWWFVLETLLIAVLPESWVRFLPYVAGFTMLGVAVDVDAAGALGDTLGRGEAGVVFGGYALMALALGTVALHRREPS